MKIKTILIVDDEEPIYSYLRKKLAKQGYEVHVADDGEKALQKVFDLIPDIVLLDVKLPKINGIDICKTLKTDARTQAIPILMLSAKAQSDEIREGLDAGADRYLCKPIGFPDILKEIKQFED